jgi:hypothetical protein
LKDYFYESPRFWDEKEANILADTLNLTYRQVVKWNWDRRVKDGLVTRKYKKPIN